MQCAVVLRGNQSGYICQGKRHVPLVAVVYANEANKPGTERSAQVTAEEKLLSLKSQRSNALRNLSFHNSKIIYQGRTVGPPV